MIVIILGTRAELIKIVPIMLELQRRGIDYTFIHTGQHDLGYFPELFGVKKPDITLTEPPKDTTTKFWSKMYRAFFWNLVLVPRIWQSLRKIKNKKYVIYHGDTMSTMSAAVASSRLLNPFKKYKNAHIEGGLRSGSLFEPFPEEISRIFSDAFSDVIFAVSGQSDKNIKWRTGKKIYQFGNTVVDATILAVKLSKNKKLPPELKKNRYALMTLHRFENIKSRKRLSSIVDIVNAVPYKIYWVMHDNTRRQLEKFDLIKRINAIISKEVDYLSFVNLLANCKFLITDGGGVQEESLTMKKPCVILRKRTERIEGLATGTNFLTKLEPELAKEYIEKILSNKLNMNYKNPYGDGTASKKIVEALAE